MHAFARSFRITLLGIALLAASGPAIDGLGFMPQPLDAAYAFKKLGGADKIGWARKFRTWCKENEANGQCSYVNSLKSPKCVNAAIKNFKGACPAKH